MVLEKTVLLLVSQAEIAPSPERKGAGYENDRTQSDSLCKPNTEEDFFLNFNRSYIILYFQDNSI